MSDEMLRLSFTQVGSNELEDLLALSWNFDGQHSIYIHYYRGVLFVYEKPFDEDDIRQFIRESDSDVCSILEGGD